RLFVFFPNTLPTIHYTLSLHDALPICSDRNNSEGLETSRKPNPVISNTPISSVGPKRFLTARRIRNCCEPSPSNDSTASTMCSRSEEHTSELQSPDHLVCRLLLEKKTK